MPQSSWVTAVKLLLETFPVRSAFPLESLEDEGYRSREGKEWMRACVSAKSLQSCLTLCDSKNCSPPGSSVCGISQARILEWVAFPPPGDLPNPAIKHPSPALAGGFFTTQSPGFHFHLKPLRVSKTQQRVWVYINGPLYFLKRHEVRILFNSTCVTAKDPT